MFNCEVSSVYSQGKVQNAGDFPVIKQFSRTSQPWQCCGVLTEEEEGGPREEETGAHHL